MIDSLNRDKPFDRFLIEQIAGDEIAPDDPECQAASTFHRLGPVRRNAGNPEIALSRNEVLTERTDILGTAFLGLTVGCARCHNHKLEPIAQKDYYRLQAYLAATEEHDIVLATGRGAGRLGGDEPARSRTRSRRSRSEGARGPTGEEKVRLTAEIEALEDQMPAAARRRSRAPGTTSSTADRDPRPEARRLGEQGRAPSARGRRACWCPTTCPSCPPTSPTRGPGWPAGSLDPEHPLTARVFVNRLWQHHFGAGLVKTVNDFGTKGDRPSHPELLDWLAATLVEDGWRLKPIHRLIVLSSTYRQSSRSPAGGRGRAESTRRTACSGGSAAAGSTAEEIRDAMLAVSGPAEPQGRRAERDGAGRPGARPGSSTSPRSGRSPATRPSTTAARST